MAKLILVVGPSGCGKSTLTEHLAEVLSLRFGASSCKTLRQDDYFTQDFKDYDNREDDSFETAEHIDWVKLRSDLGRLLSGSHIVIVEGHHVASREADLRRLASFAVIIEGNATVSRNRRLQRRRRSPEEHKKLARYFDNYVWPSHLKYGKPAQRQLGVELRQRKCPIQYVSSDDKRTAAQLAEDAFTTFFINT